MHNVQAIHTQDTHTSDELNSHSKTNQINYRL